MKYYAQFTQIRDTKWSQDTCEWTPCTPYHQDILGSIGIFILDGRNNLDTMIHDAIDQAMRLAQVSKIDGFRIMNSYDGRFSNSHQVFFQEYSN